MSTPRRDIKTRDRKWAQNLARFVATKTKLTPNEISSLSVLCAAIAFSAYGAYLIPGLPDYMMYVLPIIAILGIQSRLLCNLIDGMVAIEGGKKSVVGDIYNEFPDRLSDTLIIAGAGFAGGTCLTIGLGLLAALFAMFTAYTRVLGGAIGANQYFIGPMAKQHRMALLTVATLICLAGGIVKNLVSYVFTITLSIIILGCIITVWRRVNRIAKDLEAKAANQE